MKIRSLVKILISCFLIIYILYLVNFHDIAEILKRSNFIFFIIFIIFIYIDRTIMSYKWRMLLLKFDIRIPLFSIFRIYLTSSLAGMVLPATIGGDLFRLYGVARYARNLKAIAASIVVERVIGFVAMLGLASVSLLVGSFIMQGDGPPFFGMAWLLLCGGLVAAVLLGMTSDRSRGFVEKIAQKFKQIAFVTKLFHVYTMCCAYNRSRGLVLLVFIWSCIEQLIPILTNFFLVKALHIEVSFVELFVIIPLIILAIRLPISFEGIGIQEGLYIALFSLVGISSSEAFLVSLANRILLLFSSFPWGVYYIIYGNSEKLGSHNSGWEEKKGLEKVSQA